MARSTSQLRVLWAPHCQGPWARVSLHGEGAVTVRASIVDAVLALNACLVAHDYRTRKADTGAYNCRRITGGTGYSLHAYGVACDINWQSNPYGKRLVTDMPAAMVAAIKGIRTNSGAQVWRWGGDYSGNKDAMHFEVVASPAELASGINPATVPGAAPAPKPAPKPGKKTVWSVGDTGPFVENIQKVVGATVDGKYGPETKRKVAEFQAKLGVTADGEWGPVTQAAADRLFAYLAAVEAAKKAEAAKPTTDWALIAAIDAEMRRRPYQGLLTTATRRAKPKAVEAVQWRLTANGFECKVDGDYYKGTAAAVLAFQKSRRDLADDSKTGKHTWNALGLRRA